MNFMEDGNIQFGIYEESDQSAIFLDIAAAHLAKHGGEIDENCGFCKNFLISDRVDLPLMTFKFITLDVSEEN